MEDRKKELGAANKGGGILGELNHLAQGGGPTGGLSRRTGDSRGGALVVQEMRQPQ